MRLNPYYMKTEEIYGQICFNEGWGCHNQVIIILAL